MAAQQAAAVLMDQAHTRQRCKEVWAHMPSLEHRHLHIRSAAGRPDIGMCGLRVQGAIVRGGGVDVGKTLPVFTT